jgi:arylformamidase
MGVSQCLAFQRRSKSTLCVRRLVRRSSGQRGADDGLARKFGLPIDTVKGGLIGSGMYDLYPVSVSARSNYVTFTGEVVEALSAQRHLDRLVAPVIVAHGTLETAEFQRQSREFAAALKAAGKPVTLLVGEGYDHFELHETLGNPSGVLGRAVLEQMKLKTG